MKVPRIIKEGISYEGETYVYLNEGNTRAVFVNKSKTHVIKIDINKHLCYNHKEFEVYKNATALQRSEMAKTELINIPSLGDLIKQEYCTPISDQKLSFKQMQFINSCRQNVGFTKDGNLVCYDLEEYKKY